MTDSFDAIFADKDTVMIILAHPDDTELYCGGTVTRLIASGKRVITVKMTNGGRGTKQTRMTEEDLLLKRISEDSTAMKELGIPSENNFRLGIQDGEVENDIPTIEKIAALIRQFRPDLIITHNPEDVIIRFKKGMNWVNHRDHRKTGQVAIDAAYPYSRDWAFFPWQINDALPEFKPTVEFLLVDFYLHDDCVKIDITEQVETKVKVWACHVTQYDEETVREYVDLLNKDEDTGKYYESYRYVVAD
jgi:LmbE family N-acetylglucosaminyl deacetylase